MRILGETKDDGCAWSLFRCVSLLWDYGFLEEIITACMVLSSKPPFLGIIEGLYGYELRHHGARHYASLQL